MGGLNKIEFLAMLKVSEVIHVMDISYHILLATLKPDNIIKNLF
jgi:hypothetical protein